MNKQIFILLSLIAIISHIELQAVNPKALQQKIEQEKKKQAAIEAASKRSSGLDVLPKDIQVLILQFATGNTLDEAIAGIKRFYIASPKSRESIATTRAILSHLMNKFGLEEGKELQNVVDKLSKLESFPVFKNAEMQAWIEKEKKRLDDEFALRDAAGKGNLQQVKDFVERGVAINTPKKNQSPLSWAIQKNHFDVAKYLIEHGADVNAQGFGLKKAPLIDAAQFANPKIVELLLANGANVNAKDTLGNTALMWGLSKTAVRRQFEGEDTKSIAAMLLNAGADPNALNSSEYSALSYIISNFENIPFYTDIISLLLEKGAKPNIGKITHYQLGNLASMPILRYVRDVLHNEDLANLLIKHGTKE